MTPITLLKLNQLNSKAIFIGKIKYSQLKNKVIITKREISNKNEYQREYDRNRISNIAEFLKNTNQVCPFPTPIILALDVETDIKVYQSKEQLSLNEMTLTDYLNFEEPKSLLMNSNKNSDLDEENINDFFELLVPDNINDIFIVDGQHRYKGIEKFIHENALIDDIELSVTFLINYDIYEQSEVFANINFKQKPVNKSLYYDIFGVLPGRNEFTFTHFLVNSINKSQEFKGLIKMLGKGNGIVSLAFMVETINKYILGSKGKVYKIFDEYTKLDDIEDSLKILKLKDGERILKIETLEKELELDSKDFEAEKINNLLFLLKLSDSDKLEKIKDLETKFNKDYEYKKLPKIFIDYLAFYDLTFNEYTPKMNSLKEYKSLEYKYYMFKATGMLGVLKIFNDLIEKNTIDIIKYNEEEKSYFIDYNKEKFYNSLKKEMSLILKKPSFFFDDERFKSSASSSLQITFYKMLYSAIFEKKYNQHYKNKANEELDMD